ncbi:MAG: transposase [Thaumarchaeota archaeon]|nr:transposase [Nitrososphaerota archaeon]
MENPARRSFFRLLKLKREGRLPPFMTRISAPGYRKKRKSRTLWTIVRKDQYEMSGDRIIIKCLGAVGWIEVRYKGPIYLRGAQGRLEIRYDDDRGKRYAYITFSKVSEKMVRGEWKPAPQRPKGNLTVGIDIGINNLMAIYVEDGSTRLINGRPLKPISYYWRKKIAEYQSVLNKYGLETSKRLRRMYTKWKRQVKHYINTKVREVIEWLYHAGVSTIKVGYPKGIAQENGDLNNVYVWTYRYLLKRIAEVAEEYGINVIYVDESYTSSRCPWHGDGCGIRVYRGLFKCTKLGKVFNADLIAAYNIFNDSDVEQYLDDASSPRAPERGRGNGRRPGQGLNLQKEGCSPNLPTPNGEEVVFSSEAWRLFPEQPPEDRAHLLKPFPQKQFVVLHEDPSH